MHHTGDNLRNQIGPNAIWISVAAMHSWLFVRILSTAAVKMVDKSQTNETYSLLNFPTLSLSLSLPGSQIAYK
jgi:hypothetical protein